MTTAISIRRVRGTARVRTKDNAAEIATDDTGTLKFCSSTGGEIAAVDTFNAQTVAGVKTFSGTLAVTGTTAITGPVTGGRGAASILPTMRSPVCTPTWISPSAWPHTNV